MASDQPFVVDSLKSEKESRWYNALLAAITVDEGVEPSDHDCPQLSAYPFFEDLDVTDKAIVG